MPSAFETALGDDFDGVATYRLDFATPDDWSPERTLLHFEAVATEADVFLDGAHLGRHLGGWTPFRFDVTDALAKGGSHRLEVRVDEKVGHDTQGFLPIIQPHFGGIWQRVALLGVGANRIDDLGVLAVGDPEAGTLRIEAPRIGEGELTVDLDPRLHATDARAWVEGRGVAGFEPWDVGTPALYDVTLHLVRAGAEVDVLHRRVAFRSLRAEGRRLLLNGRPLSVRGVLEWGCFPPSLAPDRDPQTFRREVAEARARGFNLVKFCLWVPPSSLLDVLDEEGMLGWQEYPTWHPSFSAETRDALFAEFEEFYARDRNHPCLALRSLTCETGPSAPLDAITELYQRAKRAIPGALVEDDSSWIAWNRVHDFYDDHPYGNNDVWPDVLRGFDRFIQGRGKREAKPMLLGEAIAADTWLDRSLLAGLPERAAPRFAPAQARWEEKVAARFGRGALAALAADSQRFALAQRKDQIETFRRELPDGGYVVSVARDFHLATMGLNDVLDRPKWPANEWAWHGDTMLLLETGTPRSLEAGGSVTVNVLVAHYGKQPLPAGSMKWRFGSDSGALDHPEIAPGSCLALGGVVLRGPVVTVVNVPGGAAPPRSTWRKVELEARIGSGAGEVANAWPFCVVPNAREPAASPNEVVEIRGALDAGTIERIERGARVLLRNGAGPGAFEAPAVWWLTGAPWFPHPLADELGHDLLVELFPKDLHPSGLIPLARLIDHVAPIVGFWQTHDALDVADRAAAFETRVGSGRLIVTTLGNDTAAGRDLEQRFIRRLAGAEFDAPALPPELVQAMKDRLSALTDDLTPRPWRFKPDGAADWVEFAIGRAWESDPRFATLDGWATYAIDLDLDSRWQGQPLWLAIDGADDAFEVRFDGQLRGRGGDIAKRETAFDAKSTHRLAESLAGPKHRLEIRVYDWYGAGGLHRPIRLSTRPLDAAADFLIAR